MPPPQGTFSCLRHWLVLVVFLVVFVPLRSPSADEPPPPVGSDDCPEARRWPTFCSALLNTSLLNDTARRRVEVSIPRAKAFFCDMVRVLNKIDCAQPFTVSPKWRLGCQEAYRDWSCSLLADGLFPVGLNSCDSTCHQVIRVCPYLSPDRVQVDATGKAALHPSQYGGHPAFHCPTTYTDSNHHHTEDYFFRRSTPDPDALVCILFNPSEAGLSHASFPLHTLDLRNFSVTYCQDYGGSRLDDPHPLLTDKRGRVNVSQCCWTYNTALPRTFNALSSTLQRRVLKDENCVPLSKNLHEKNPLHFTPDQETLKQVFLQCLVTQDTSIPPESYDYEVYLDDDPIPNESYLIFPPSERKQDTSIPPYPISLSRDNREDAEDPSIDRFNSAEGEDSEEDEEYDFPRATSTTEAFLSLIASLDSQTTPHYLQTPSTNWRERRSLATQSPNATSYPSPNPTRALLLLLLVTALLLPSLLVSVGRGGGNESRIQSPSTPIRKPLLGSNESRKSSSLVRPPRSYSIQRIT